ncbi:lysoplasmalogenase [Leifsonia sp. NPDC058292]|uniref:lysoplasmalogenase n=1 Tax=Leifsonia sp. NPDC058292 TaxID=3346428 RepID=UPI0036D7ED64
MAIPFLPYTVVGILHLLALFFGAETISTLTKPLLMPALLLAFLLTLPRRRGEVALLGSLAILFGWLGDVSLLDAGAGFLIGLGFFLLGHLAYLVLFLRRMRLRRRPRWWAAVYLVWWVALVGILAPHAGVLLAPLAVYGLILGALAAWGSTCNRWIAVGSASFLASDTLLGLDRFLPDFSVGQVDFLIMLTYLAGQALMAWGIVQTAAVRPTVRPASLSGRRAPGR